MALNTGSLTEPLLTSGATYQSITVPITNFNNTLFQVGVSVGTPPQYLPGYQFAFGSAPSDLAIEAAVKDYWCTE